MSLKITVGLAKKIGQPDFGSLGATCNVEFELDGGYDNGSTQHFQDAVRRAYIACREAVEAEIETSRSATTTPVGGQQHSPPSNRIANQNANGSGTTGHFTGNNSNNGSSGNGRGATTSQVRAIYAISNRNGVDLQAVLSSQFGVHRPDDLSIRDASSLIDQLKQGATDNSAVAR